MMLRIGILPAEVSDTKESSSTWSPFSLPLIYARTWSRGLLPSQRGPKATISLVYCIARAASMWRAGPTGSIALGGELGAGCVSDWGDEGAPAAEAALSLEHPVPVRERTRTNAALNRKHKLTSCAPATQILDRRSPALKPFRGTLPVYCMSWFLRLSARLRRCLGWTSQTRPMLPI